jgi:hypothetical protein
LKRVPTDHENGQVPGGPGRHQHRSVRVPDEEWAEFGERAAAAGTDRAKLIVAFIRWWLRLPGAELPERPKGGRR